MREIGLFVLHSVGRPVSVVEGGHGGRILATSRANAGRWLDVRADRAFLTSGRGYMARGK